jgi:hypothetical protein
MRANVLLVVIVIAIIAVLAWVAFAQPGVSAPACRNAEASLPAFKVSGKAEIITGARLDIYAHLALEHLGLDLTGSRNAILVRKPGHDLVTFEDAGGCLLPIEVRVPTTEFV